MYVVSLILLEVSSESPSTTMQSANLKLLKDREAILILLFIALTPIFLFSPSLLLFLTRFFPCLYGNHFPPAICLPFHCDLFHCPRPLVDERRRHEREGGRGREGGAGDEKIEIIMSVQDYQGSQFVSPRGGSQLSQLGTILFH